MKLQELFMFGIDGVELAFLVKMLSRGLIPNYQQFHNLIQNTMKKLQKGITKKLKSSMMMKKNKSPNQLKAKDLKNK
jgi:hypothetical protein